MNAVSSRPHSLDIRTAGEMAERDPDALIQLVESGSLGSPELCAGIEMLGHVRTDRARRLILEFCRPEHPGVVRESAVYALGHRAEYETGALDALHYIAESDPSPAVRRAVQDVLDC